jgi:hypothetical protein
MSNLNIDYRQPLSEQFIEQNKDSLHWCYISECQDLSEEFIEPKFMHPALERFLLLCENLLGVGILGFLGVGMYYCNVLYAVLYLMLIFWPITVPLLCFCWHSYTGKIE